MNPKAKMLITKSKVRQLAEDINAAVKPNRKPTMDEIVAEVRKFRAGK